MVYCCTYGLSAALPTIRCALSLIPIADIPVMGYLIQDGAVHFPSPFAGLILPNCSHSHSSFFTQTFGLRFGCTHSTQLELLDNTLGSSGLDTSGLCRVDVRKDGHGGELEMGLDPLLHGQSGVLRNRLEGPSVNLLLGRHVPDGVILEHLGVDVARRRLELGQSHFGCAVCEASEFEI